MGGSWPTAELDAACTHTLLRSCQVQCRVSVMWIHLDFLLIDLEPLKVFATQHWHLAYDIGHKQWNWLSFVKCDFMAHIYVALKYTTHINIYIAFQVIWPEDKPNPQIRLTTLCGNIKEASQLYVEYQSARGVWVMQWKEWRKGNPFDKHLSNVFAYTLG